MAYQAELDFALNLAHQAGDIMRANLGTSATSWKADNSPVTEADLAINDLVIKLAQQTFPADGILGEEASLNPDTARRWVVDPIDGTQAFDMGAPLSTFCLGLVEDGQPVLGVVYDPFMDRMYSAVRGEGAFLNGEPLHVSDVTGLEKQYVFVSSRMGGEGRVTTGQATDRLIDAGAKCFNVRSIVYGFTRVAAGASIAALAGSSHPWDLAAAFVILEESGAKITDLDGAPVRYDAAHNGVLVSNGLVHEQIIDMMKL